MSKQVESTQEELYKMETQRDELQVKVEMQEKQLEDAMAKESELQVVHCFYNNTINEAGDL